MVAQRLGAVLKPFSSGFCFLNAAIHFEKTNGAVQTMAQSPAHVSHVISSRHRHLVSRFLEDVTTLLEEQQWLRCT